MKNYMQKKYKKENKNINQEKVKNRKKEKKDHRNGEKKEKSRTIRHIKGKERYSMNNSDIML